MSSHTLLPEKQKIFGTDGIRGEAGVFPLNAEAVAQIGRAIAAVFFHGATSPRPACIIGRDTRASGEMLEAALAEGLTASGVDVYLAGIVPTPAVAYLTQTHGSPALGIVVSASHNPFQDNGIKIFGPDGYKLPDETEDAIEQTFYELLETESTPAGASSPKGTIISMEDAASRYVDFVIGKFGSGEGGEGPLPLQGLKLVLDCANGASYQTSKAALTRLGAEAVTFFDSPDGKNINVDCGSTHPEAIETLVLQEKADAGVSHDGDADRVLLCDETGSSLDGDELLAIAAASYLDEGKLAGKTLVATVMSNYGLDDVVTEHGGQVLRTPVGDRHVILAMREGGYNLGGEQSGHLIFRDFNTTGDGLVAAAVLLAIAKKSGKPLSELRTLLKKFPQAQRNVKVSSKPPLEELEAAQQAISETETELGAAGRVLVRYSGTEKLLRILIEGRNEAYIHQQADAIAGAVRQQIGA